MELHLILRETESLHRLLNRGSDQEFAFRVSLVNQLLRAGLNWFVNQYESQDDDTLTQEAVRIAHEMVDCLKQAGLQISQE